MELFIKLAIYIFLKSLVQELFKAQRISSVKCNWTLVYIQLSLHECHIEFSFVSVLKLCYPHGDYSCWSWGCYKVGPEDEIPTHTQLHLWKNKEEKFHPLDPPHAVSPSGTIIPPISPQPQELSFWRSEAAAKIQKNIRNLHEGKCRIEVIILNRGHW